MSLPASGFHAAYRNHVRDVATLLKKKHQDHYLVCLERCVALC